MPEFVVAAAEAWSATAFTVEAAAATVAVTWGNVIVATALVYGTVQQRNAARKMAAAQRDAYNAGLQDRTVSIVSADNPWQILYGEPTVGPAYVAILTSGDKDQFKHLVAVWAAHECDSIQDVLLAGESVGALDGDGYVTGGKWFKGETHTENEVVTLDGAGVATVAHAVAGLIGVSYTTGSGQDVNTVVLAATAAGNTVTLSPELVAEWAGRTVNVNYTWSDGTAMLRVRHHLGADDQTADTALLAEVPDDWSSSDRGRGLCYSVFTFNLNEPEFQGGPPAPTARIRGRKVYDPRLDSTQPGGSGPQRADDASTWTWNPNCALCTTDFIRAKYGKCAATSQMLWDSVVAGANVCDGTVTVDGEAQPRYTCNGMFRTDVDPDVTLDQLCQSMAGFATFTGAWHVQAGAYTAPVMALTDADNMGAVEVVPSPAANEVMNGLRGRFYDPNLNDQLTDYVPYKNAAFVTEDGGEYFDTLDLPFTNSAWRAHNLARIQVERSRGMQLVYPAKMRALKLKPGQRVTLKNEVLNLDEAVFRVVKREYQPGGPVKLTLTFDDPSFYDEVDAPAVVLPPTMYSPDPFHVDFVQALSAEASDDTVLVDADERVLPRVRLSFAASTDALVTGNGELQIEYRLETDTVWQRAPSAPGNSVEAFVLGVAVNRFYVLRVRWVNGIGSFSDWRSVGVEVPVPSLIPGDVTGFGVERTFPGGVELRWDGATRNALRTELRLNGSDWASGLPIFSGNGDGFPFTWEADGHYVIRARRGNLWGVYSATDAVIEFDVADGYMLLNCPAAWYTSGGETAVWQASIEDPESGEVIGYTPAVWLCGPIDTRVSTPEIADYAVTDGLSLTSSLAYPLTYLYRPHLVDPINLTPLVDLFVDLTVVADLSISFDGYDWGTPYIRTAAAEAAYTVEADFTGYPSGPPLETAGTGNYWQTAGATGWVFGPEQSATRVRATYTLRSSFALSAGVSYRVGLVADGDPSEFGAGSTVYALSTSITLRKK